MLVVGSDLDHMNTMGWRLPLPGARAAINIDGADAAKNYAMDAVVEADALKRSDRSRGSRTHGARRGSTTCPRSRGRCANCAPTTTCAGDRVPRAHPHRAPRRRGRVRRHVHPRLLALRAVPGREPARPALPDGLGHARLRVRGVDRRRGRGRPAAAGRRGDRRRRHAVRARRARRPSRRSGSRSRSWSSTTAATGCCATGAKTIPTTAATSPRRLRRGRRRVRHRGRAGRRARRRLRAGARQGRRERRAPPHPRTPASCRRARRRHAGRSRPSPEPKGTTGGISRHLRNAEHRRRRAPRGLRPRHRDRALVAGRDHGSIVDGEHRRGIAGQEYEERSPIDRDLVIGTFACASPDDVRDAVTAARAAAAGVGRRRRGRNGSRSSNGPPTRSPSTAASSPR